MRIKLLVGVAGSDYAYQKGGEYDCDAERAADLIKAGHAVAVGKETEKAVQKGAAEKAKKK